ncbi:LOW QUALITY PROTEIN: hypothetical protein RvY_18444 [Ramazzottius varieornatus]|uniref:Uncharacterized protein n=1 Tax=Ramazzottius varieornatus TaxID=947166 RepID=A0A1D1W7C8_RAMVA|nr:LOW QUALITY PROTEIN: hypothetical protein RvY_18444 [Ramazzottius varieornatus]
MQPDDPLQKKLRRLFEVDVGKDLILGSANVEERHRAGHLWRKFVRFPRLSCARIRAWKSRTVATPCNTLPRSLRTRYCIYYDSREGLARYTEDVLELANSYKMNELKEACERILPFGLTSRNVCGLAPDGLRFTCPIMKTAALSDLRHVAVNLRALEDTSQIEAILNDNNAELAQEVINGMARWRTR